MPPVRLHTGHTSRKNSVERTSSSLPHLCWDKPVSRFLFIFFNTSEIASEFELSFYLNAYLSLKTTKRQYMLLSEYFIVNFMY